MVKKQSDDKSSGGKSSGVPNIGNFRVREDGALCWGDGCLVIKPEGKDLRISINESECSQDALEAYRQTVDGTIGHGGKTIYEVPGKIVNDEEPKGKSAK